MLAFHIYQIDCIYTNNVIWKNEYQSDHCSNEPCLISSENKA